MLLFSHRAKRIVLDMADYKITRQDAFAKFEILLVGEAIKNLGIENFDAGNTEHVLLLAKEMEMSVAETEILLTQIYS